MEVRDFRGEHEEEEGVGGGGQGEEGRYLSPIEGTPPMLSSSGTTHHFPSTMLPSDGWDADELEGLAGWLLQSDEADGMPPLVLPQPAPLPPGLVQRATNASNQEEDERVEASATGANTNTSQPILFPCHQCRQVKTRCDRTMPCSRCVRLGLECRQQSRKPVGRPLSLHKPRTAPIKREAPILPAPPPTTSERSTRLRRSTRKKEMAAPTPSNGSDDGSSDSGGKATMHGRSGDAMANLITKAVDVQIKAFLRMKAGGRADNERVACYVRQWIKYQQRYKEDISVGLRDVISYTLDRRLRGQFGVPIITRDPNFNPRDEGLVLAEGSLPRFIQELKQDRISAVVGDIYHQEQLRMFCNERFSKRFAIADDMDERLKRLGIAPCLLWCSVLHPDEVQSFYTNLIEYQLSPPQPQKEMSIICKCIDRHGKEVVSLLRIRSIMLMGGDYSASILSIFPLPGSRHVHPFPIPRTPALAPLLPPSRPRPPSLEQDNMMEVFNAPRPAEEVMREEEEEQQLSSSSTHAALVDIGQQHSSPVSLAVTPTIPALLLDPSLQQQAPLMVPQLLLSPPSPRPPETFNHLGTWRIPLSYQFH